MFVCVLGGGFFMRAIQEPKMTILLHETDFHSSQEKETRRTVHSTLKCFQEVTSTSPGIRRDKSPTAKPTDNLRIESLRTWVICHRTLSLMQHLRRPEGR